MGISERLKHVVLIGLNYKPERSSGDKNFWVELIPLLAARLNRITVLSIKKYPVPEEEFVINACHIKVKYLSPKFLESSDSTYSRRRIFWREGAFPSWMGVVEKALNIKRLLYELKIIYRDYPYQHIHLMDNMGFANRMIANRARTSVSVSAMAYQGKNPRWLYDKYLLVSYKSKNLTVVPYSEAFSKKLTEIGIEPARVHMIRWGVSINGRRILTNYDKTALKKKIGVNEKAPLILWTGYIQQVVRKDFLFAYDTAIEALNYGLDATFFFAFKPESFENGFESYNNPGNNILVTPTTTDKFKDLLLAADFLFSPVINPDCILAPPLTWIEAMNLGMPILTTNVSGAAEIVEDGKTGFIAQSKNDLVKKLFLFNKNFISMQPACRKKVRRDYNADNIASMYLKLWRESI